MPNNRFDLLLNIQTCCMRYELMEEKRSNPSSAVMRSGTITTGIALPKHEWFNVCQDVLIDLPKTQFPQTFGSRVFYHLTATRCFPPAQGVVRPHTIMHQPFLVYLFRERVELLPPSTPTYQKCHLRHNEQVLANQVRMCGHMLCRGPV